MSCAFCRVVGWFLLNLLIVLDVTVNTLLLGRPPETVSQRFARLREYGGPKSRRIGVWFCAILTFIAALFGSRRDHCTWALDPNGHDGTEIWRWSK